MFTANDRETRRDALIAAARADDRINGAALLGSAAIGREDAWSDVDLALRVDPSESIPAVIDDWTATLYEGHAAVHHFDVRSGRTTYRVFLLADTLQVDLSFWAPRDFRAAGPTFRLLFGEAGKPRPVATADVGEQAGLAWLYLLHVRSSLARGRRQQAEYMVAQARYTVLALACGRRGLSTGDGRGFDDLPAEIQARSDAGRPSRSDAESLRAAGAAVGALLLDELAEADAELAQRLTGVVFQITA